MPDIASLGRAGSEEADPAFACACDQEVRQSALDGAVLPPHAQIIHRCLDAYQRSFAIWDIVHQIVMQLTIKIMSRKRRGSLLRTLGCARFENVVEPGM
jgi:hypothetical protein